MDNDAILLQDILVLDRLGIDESGKVRGMFRATGIRPKFADRPSTFRQPPAPGAV